MTIKRITFLQELLAFIGLEERLHLSWISSAEAGKFIQVVSQFTEKVRSLGPNPLREFELQSWLDTVGAEFAQQWPDSKTITITD